MHAKQKRGATGAASFAFAAIVGILLIALTGCDTTPQPQTHIGSWPYWKDVQVSCRDYDVMWRTTVDVLSEDYPIEVLDKDGGYLKTEWKVYTVPNPSTDSGFENDAVRYSAKIYPATGIIRLGAEIKNNDTGVFFTTIKGDATAFNQFVWRGIPEQLQLRLKDAKSQASSSSAKPQTSSQ
jgi:hypothetical protein